jgi:hypothetical protein
VLFLGDLDGESCTPPLLFLDEAVGERSGAVGVVRGSNSLMRGLTDAAHRGDASR